jgi:hypothetical protein
MQSTTVRRRAQGPKPFAWSYSRLKNFETCPKKYWHNDVAKDVQQEESEALMLGNEAHKAIAAYIEHGKQLPVAFIHYQEQVDRCLLTPSGKSIRAIPGVQIKTEQQLAITAEFGPCAWFGPEAWYRGIGDLVWVAGRAAYVADWKTGKVIEDSPQLGLLAQCIFAHYPEVERVRSEFIWLKEDATTRVDVSRADMAQMWVDIFPRLRSLQEAHAQTLFPAKPSGLCRWCNVKVCPNYSR